jgi:hypothetical protein
MENITTNLYKDILMEFIKSGNINIINNDIKLKKTIEYYRNITQRTLMYIRDIYEDILIMMLKEEITNIHIIELLRISVINEHYKMMKYVLEEIKKVNRKEEININQLIYYGIKNNSVRTLEWIYNNFDFEYEKYILDHIRNTKQIEILEWWKMKGLRIEYTYKLVDNASIEIIEWLYKNKMKIIYRWMIENNTIEGNIKVLDWFYEHKMEIKFEYTEIWIGKNAIKVLEWFKKRKNEIPIKYTENLINNASRDNKIEVLDWIYKNRNNGFNFIYTEEAIINACEMGLINVLDWFWEKRYNIKFKYDINCIKYAKNTKVLDWFWDKRNEIEFLYDTEIIDYASKSIIKWFIDKHLQNDLSFIYTDLIFILNKDNIEVLEMLNKNGLKQLNTNIEHYIIY